MENKESINSILKEVYKVAKRELKTMPEDDEEVDLKHCCPHCGAPQEAIILDKPVTIRQGDYKLTPSEVRERLEKITDDDAFVLGVNSEVEIPDLEVTRDGEKLDVEYEYTVDSWYFETISIDDFCKLFDLSYEIDEEEGVVYFTSI